MDKSKFSYWNFSDWPARCSAAGSELMEAATTFEHQAINWVKDCQGVIEAQVPKATELDAWLSKMAAQFPGPEQFAAAGGELMKAAAIYEQRAIAWVEARQDLMQGQIPTANEVEAWLAKMAAQCSWTEAPHSTALEHLEATLIDTVAAISQQSDRRIRMLMNTVIGKITGSVTVAGIPALIAAFGTASTGTPIVILAGAAQTTAQLYWLGSLVGLGTAAGGIILTSTGLGVAVLAGLAGRRWLLGTPRDESGLHDHERAILMASLSLITALRQQIESGKEVRPEEMRLVAEQALVPLVNQINQHWDRNSLETNGITGCRAFTETLAFIHRRKLDHCRTELGRIAMAAMAADKTQ